MKTTMIAFVLCALCAGARAQTVTVADVEALPGETVEFVLDLTGGKADTYKAMQFDVQFPATGFATTGSYRISELWPNAMAIIGSLDANGIATIPVASSEAIGAADVEGLLSVSFSVGNDVAIGEYDVTLSNLWFGYGTSSKDYTDDVTFKVNVVAAHQVVLDETSTEAPEAAEDANVRVKRTIKANEWSTIVLPFAMTTEQVKAAFGEDVELEDFVSYEYDETEDALTINFTAVTAMEANHPYIIKVSSLIEEFSADGVDIDPEEDPCKEYKAKNKKGKEVLKGKFAGTYVADFDFYNEATYSPLFLSGNKFYYATENTMHMKAFRGYFDFVDMLETSEESSARIGMSFDDDENTTGVKHVQTSKEEAVYYNLNGQRVEKPTRGLYIKNHKKVIVR